MGGRVLLVLVNWSVDCLTATTNPHPLLASLYERDDKKPWSLLLPPWCSENALSLQDPSPHHAVLPLVIHFCLLYCSILSSPHNLTFAMRYPFVPYMGVVPKATGTPPVVHPPNSLSQSLSFSLLFPHVLFCHVIMPEFSQIYIQQQRLHALCMFAAGTETVELVLT